MTPLPPVEPLIQRCRALAALELILCPDWQFRYYSFNAIWSEAEMMASMRDGSGDEWWMVFNRTGWAGLKGLAHKSPAWKQHRETLSAALQRSFPDGLKGFSTEPAFRWSETSFAYFHTAGAAHWTRVNDLTDYSMDDAGDDRLLAHLIGDAAAYATFATNYYEREVDERIVAGVFAIQPITEKIVASLNPAISLRDISVELYSEIRYPLRKPDAA